jgi:hypothetical protein
VRFSDRSLPNAGLSGHWFDKGEPLRGVRFVEPGVKFRHWDRESCGTAITADGDLREQEEGALVEISSARSMESEFAAVRAEFGRAAGAAGLNYDWVNKYDAGLYALSVLFPPLEFVRWDVEVGLAAVGADHHITEGPQDRLVDVFQSVKVKSEFGSEFGEPRRAARVALWLCSRDRLLRVGHGRPYSPERQRPVAVIGAPSVSANCRSRAHVRLCTARRQVLVEPSRPTVR